MQQLHSFLGLQPPLPAAPAAPAAAAGMAHRVQRAQARGGAANQRTLACTGNQVRCTLCSQNHQQQQQCM
jgi:hypothetical protein